LNKNKTTLVLASTVFSFSIIILFVFAAAFAFALSGSSTNYGVYGIQGLGGSQGSSTNYDAGVTAGFEPSGSGSSTNYQLCLGYWCEEEQQQQAPCEPPASGNWVIPPRTTVVCRDRTINMPTNGNLTINGTLIFNNVVLNMMPSGNGNSIIRVEPGGFFDTRDIPPVTGTQHSVIQSPKGNAYLFQVYGGIYFENNAIKNVGYYSPAPPRAPKYGIYLNGATPVTLKNNVISDTIYGIVLENTNGASILGNSISVRSPDTSPRAVYMTASGDNNVANNEFSGYGDVAVWLQQTSNKNKFTSNKFNIPTLTAASLSVSSTDNVILDSVFTKDKLTTIDSSNATREWFHDVHVKNLQGEPIGDANVTITPKELYKPPAPTLAPNPPKFHGQIVKHVTDASGMTPQDEAIQYDQNVAGGNEPSYNPYNVTACAWRGSMVCNSVFPTLDASGTTEVELDVPSSFGCYVAPVPQTIYPPNPSNKLLVTFDDYLIGSGATVSVYCGFGEIQTFTVPKDKTPLEVNCIYPDTAPKDYYAYCRVPPPYYAYGSNVTHVLPGQGQQSVTLAAVPPSGGKKLTSTLYAQFTGVGGGANAVFYCNESAQGGVPRLNTTNANGLATMLCYYEASAPTVFTANVSLQSNINVNATTTVTLDPNAPPSVDLTASVTDAVGPFSSTLIARFVNIEGYAYFKCTAGDTEHRVLIQGDLATYDCSYPRVTENTQFTASVRDESGSYGDSVTITDRAPGAPTATAYPSDVSFLSASCPTNLVLTNETNVTAFLVVRGQPTCPTPEAPIPGSEWTLFVTRPGGQREEEIAPYVCVGGGTTVFTLSTEAEGAYVVELTAHTGSPPGGIGDLSSSCNFRVFHRPPSKFPELPLAFVALLFIGIFIFLSRYSKSESRESKSRK
jgi:parallel beta-helix repeat protein